MRRSRQAKGIAVSPPLLWNARLPAAHMALSSLTLPSPSPTLTTNATAGITAHNILKLAVPFLGSVDNLPAGG